MTLAIDCRCGSEVTITAGGAVVCPHCDSPCADPGSCHRCSKLNRTCTDCRRLFPNELRRAACEGGHNP